MIDPNLSNLEYHTDIPKKVSVHPFTNTNVYKYLNRQDMDIDSSTLLKIGYWYYT